MDSFTEKKIQNKKNSLGEAEQETYNKERDTVQRELDGKKRKKQRKRIIETTTEAQSP